MSFTGKNSCPFNRFTAWVMRAIRSIFHRGNKISFTEEQGVGFRYNQP